MNIVSPIKGGKIPLGYSILDTGHPGKHSGTLQVVSFHGFNAFLPENASVVHFVHLCSPL